MKYSFKCPPPCNYEIKVEANNDDEAVGKILKLARPIKNRLILI